MKNDAIRKLEEMSINAWPSLSTSLYDGWVIRVAEGFTKRANSINPIYRSEIDIDEKIAFCESIYKSQNIDTVFKLTEAVCPENIDSILESMGYSAVDHTSVQVSDLSNFRFSIESDNEIVISEVISYKWLEDFCRLSGKTELQKNLTEKMLKNILTKYFFISLTVDEKTASCGMGVVFGDYLGIFDIVTDEKMRKCGYGERVVRSIMQLGKLMGAKSAYLQVVQKNEAAKSLYRKLAFTEIYEYWYRVK